METAALPSAVVVSAALETEASRKSIVISLGKTSAKAKMSTKIASDLSKWNERQRELLVETKDEVAMPVVYSVPIADTPLDVEPDVTVLSIPTFNPAEHKKELVAKPSGVIACLLCRRQFQSKDQLDRHERESKLHKENLAKAKPSEAMYRDRASERRAIHGSKDIPIVYDRPDESLVGASLLNSVSFILPPSPSPPHAPPAASNIPLGVSNAGNLLLRKMGWEEGAGLGRDGDGTRVPVGLDAARRDTAGLGTSSTTSSSTAPGGERGYRASIQSATRARFEQLSAAEKK
jgi:RNA-binding protein 5/10